MLFLIPAGIYLRKINNGNTRTVYEVFHKLKINTSVGPDVIIAGFEHISHGILVFPLLTFNK